MDSDWIRVKEPLNRDEKMFINLKSGECLWEPPMNAKIRECSEQWWELFDERTQRFYYYNSSTMETKWEKPGGSELIVIPLHKLKVMKQQQQHHTQQQFRRTTLPSTIGRRIAQQTTTSTTTSDKESQTVETLKVLIDCETQTDQQLLLNQPLFQPQHLRRAEKENSLKDYLMSEARFAEEEVAMKINKEKAKEKRKEEKNKVDKAEKAEEKHEENLELFAKENIKRHLKKGGVNLLLKRKESMKGMLIWTKNSIKQPMIATIMNIGGGMKQEAILCFKLIQEWCGDRHMERSAGDEELSEEEQRLAIANELIAKGVNKGVCLRDEIYVQLCRQTTENPSEESCRRGLMLISLCLFYFGPSSKFAPYLLSFLSKHKMREEQCVRVAQAKLEKRMNLMRQGFNEIETGGFTKRAGGSKELRMVLNAIAEGNPGWFGESLQETMTRQTDEIKNGGGKYIERRLPWIQVELSETILKLGGAQTEGIFRIGPDFEEMATIRLAIDCHSFLNRIEFDRATDDVNIYASLLKQWFRELQTPVIPYSLYDKCLANCENPKEALDIILNQLPIINKLSIGHLIRFLQVFSAPQNVAKTKMDENNLSMVWSPNILRSPPPNNTFNNSAASSSSSFNHTLNSHHSSALLPSHSSSLFENTRKEMLFMKTLIKHLNTSFIQGMI
ncbi:rho GTPase-activating protein 39-like protein [Dinothrombium tinctorium]|uniref:Rho GTPase-activating protein 39-like protein n=1 Tax=Dinothrombium tinctorium TaxID=1965070 RepID=A0A3S3PU46_9ACAR|nr:rho GTPase-activating protein 39-like protein [Dinothrombium tinctorium]